MQETPKRGHKLSRTCISCDLHGAMEITGVKKNSLNADGSTCYTLKAVCGSCGYLNGEFKPIWYNHYELGVVV